MSKFIKLMLNHTSGGVVYPAGDTIEVSDEDYEFLQSAYATKREAEAEKIRELNALEQLIKDNT